MRPGPLSAQRSASPSQRISRFVMRIAPNSHKAQGAAPGDNQIHITVPASGAPAAPHIA
jgi:hypothetical protein